MKEATIVIGSLIHRDPAVFGAFLNSLKGLADNGWDIRYRFVGNESDREAVDLAERFARERKRAAVDRMSLYPESVKERALRIAEAKDRIADYARDEFCDYLFLVDSDLSLHPDTLTYLVQADRDVVSAVVWTKRPADQREMPQVWLDAQYTPYEWMLEQSAADEETVKRTLEYHKRLREPGVYEAGGVSGAILISRKALYAGVRFAPIPSVSLIGDDRHFSIRAAAIGLSLHVDTRCPAARIDAESALRAASAGEDREKPKAKTAQTEPREERQPMKRQEPITISLCMIVKNEEDAIGRCLESVRDIVDEIVIVDTGSTDRTKEIVRTFGANVFDFEWIDDFSAARNYAFAQATCEYILWLDADDYFKEKDRKLLKQLKRELDRSVDSVSMHYHLAFDANGNATHSLRRNRLVRRDRGYKWVGAVHEYLDVGGRIHLADIAVTHNKNKPYTDRNLQIYRRREKAGEPFTPRDRYYFANELRDNRFYEEAASHYVRFLDEGLGWVEDNIAACIKLADCYAKLNEPGKKLSALFKTMEYDTPRAEATYRIGVHFFEQNRIHQAIYWYELTTTLKKPVTLAMIENDMWTWMPHLQLCVCYDRIGDSERARRHNDIALSYNPTHPSMLHNKKYFESKLGVAP